MGTKNWWVGVLPLLVIWIVANFVMTGWVEQDLTARASAAVTAVGQMLDKPSVTVAGRDATLAGTPFNTNDDIDAVKAADSTSGIRLVNDAIAPVLLAKPYTFDAKRDGDRLVLSGNVPQPATRAKIIEAAKASAPGVDVVDRMIYAQGAPVGFETIAAYGIAEAGKLAGGDISLSDKAYSIAGHAPSASIYQAALAATQQLPAGATLAKVDITQDEISPPVVIAVKSDAAVLTVAACQPQLTDLLAHRKILFDTAKASIHKDSDALLKDLTATAKRCPDAHIEIAGHTDSVGKDDSNMKLSQLRANAVADYLIKAGIPPARLTAVGYGKTRPIALNTTAEGRTQNRRIEFQVK